MKIDVEKKLIEALESSDQTPNPHILDAAKEEMKKKKTSIRRSNIYKFAIAGCVIIALSLAIVLPIVFLNNGNVPNTQMEIQTIEYPSMQKYFDETGVLLVTFSEAPSSMIEEVHPNYSREGCIVIKQGDTNLFVQETYLYGGNEITLNVVIEDTEDVKREYFSEYNDCDKIYIVSKKHKFYYRFNKEKETGYAFTEYHGYTIYFKTQSETEQEMFEHFINFIGLQKN